MSKQHYLQPKYWFGKTRVHLMRCQHVMGWKNVCAVKLGHLTSYNTSLLYSFLKNEVFFGRTYNKILFATKIESQIYKFREVNHSVTKSHKIAILDIFKYFRKIIELCIKVIITSKVPTVLWRLSYHLNPH